MFHHDSAPAHRAHDTLAFLASFSFVLGLNPVGYTLIGVVVYKRINPSRLTKFYNR